MASVLVPLAEGCEELEAITIVDLLRRAGIEVVTAGLRDGPVRCSRGTVIVPDTTLDAVMDRDFDMLVLPGGLPGADNLNADPRIRELLKKLADSGHWTGAICAAPKVLASAGLLDGRHATSYPGSLDGSPVKDMVYEEKPVVIDGKVVTSRG
ncbi:MAG TPA: DJ-1/PfpI family protein, partial [Gammaproteobacteria bacterium]|nr:DJ-1/PfpI family protein [Gammaproteobacteria bacterium]